MVRHRAAGGRAGAACGGVRLRMAASCGRMLLRIFAGEGRALSCEPEIALAVRERGRRLTMQRARILSALRHASDHQTAEQVLERVRGDDPHADISLSTVYRTLETATGLQLTSELRGASGTATYEWNDPGTTHHHLECGGCGRAEEVELASLQLAIDSRANAGQCSGGHSCVYTNTICWRSRTTPLPMENNPRVVFEQMFGDGGSTDPAVRRARMRRDRSILDSVTGKVADLKREVGQADSLKVDEYLEGVRDVERRIQRAERQERVDVPELAQPEGIPAAFAEHVALMFDLQVLAHRTDLTRVTSFMLGREVSSRTYTEIGIPDAHHPLSHHKYKPEKIALMSKINAYHASMFADYLAKLRSTPDGDGSLLDHMLILYGCGMSDSNAHSPLDLPVLLLGGCGGQLEGGRHLRYAGDPLMPNLLVTLMDKLGVPVERLGQSDGRLRVERLTGV